MQLKIKQVVSIVDNLVFRNSLVAMRLKLTTSDLPAFYNIKVHLYNEFVMHMKQLKVDIDVSLPRDGWLADTIKMGFLGMIGH